MNTVTLSYTENNAFVKSTLQMLRNSEYFKVSRVKSDNPNQKTDMWKDIPDEFRCDPFEISPSGDPYWADKRNVTELEKAIAEAHDPNSKFYSYDEIKHLFEV